MSGIGVVIGDTTDQERCAAMEALSGRGPDSCGSSVRPGITVLSCRTAPRDEDDPGQPYLSERGDIAVMNGEIFNARHLQDSLGMAGASPTAVLVEGVHRHGPRFLQRIDGQFAFVMHRADGVTLAARDRFGICPLFYSLTAGRQTYASTITVLQSLSVQGQRFSVAGLASLLRDWACEAPHTPYEGIAQLLPGHVMTVSAAGDVELSRWTAPPGAYAAHRAEDAGDLAALEEELQEAIRARKRSTGSVACLISGGVDSTVIAALAAREGVRRGLALWGEDDEETRDRQRQVAAALGMDLIQHRLDASEVMSTFRRYVETRRTPLSRLGPVGMTALARRARAEGIVAVISGEGADELFCGYDAYRLAAAGGGLFGDATELDWSLFGRAEIGVGRSDSWHRAYWQALIGLRRATVRWSLLTPVTGFFGPVLAECWAEVQRPAGPPVEGDMSPEEVRSWLWTHRQRDLDSLLASYLLVAQGGHAWAVEGVELRAPYLSAAVADRALAMHPADLVTVQRGKLPVYGLLERAAARHPALYDLGFAKSAFRVDAQFLVRDQQAYAEMREAVAACPAELVRTDALLKRLSRIGEAGVMSEAESMIVVLAASFGFLAGAEARRPGSAISIEA